MFSILDCFFSCSSFSSSSAHLAALASAIEVVSHSSACFSENQTKFREQNEENKSFSIPHQMSFDWLSPSFEQQP